jgi:hypothetical protein
VDGVDYNVCGIGFIVVFIFKTNKKIMYALLCKPLPVITPTQTVIKTRDCRIVKVEPTQEENKFQVELMEAPPIKVD